jgi:hypothetical protein
MLDFTLSPKEKEKYLGQIIVEQRKKAKEEEDKKRHKGILKPQR